MLFINAKHYAECSYCVDCKWCTARGLKKEMFRLKDGPGDFWFCDTHCSCNWVRYRHVYGIAHVLRMATKERKEYLADTTIEEYVNNEFKRNSDLKVVTHV